MVQYSSRRVDWQIGLLNNLVGVFEAQVDAEDNFSDRTWEWK
jgi:hypothetical protein